MDQIYAFSGSESAPVEIVKPLRRRLSRLAYPARVITGAAEGLDTIACELAIDLWPQAEHEIVVPNFRHNRELVKRWRKKGGVKITVMPPDTGPLDRNVYMVERCTKLIACPQSATRYRSGTWHTIGRAQALHKPVLMYPLPALLRARVTL